MPYSVGKFCWQIVSSRLDYCNSLLYSIKKKDQIAFNEFKMHCAVLLPNPLVSVFSNLTPLFKSVYWLPLNFRIRYNIYLLVCKAISSWCPRYLRCFLQPYSSTRSKRMAMPELKLLVTHFMMLEFKVSIWEKFHVLWPESLENSSTVSQKLPSIASFKICLKKYLFWPGLPSSSCAVHHVDFPSWRELLST